MSIAERLYPHADPDRPEAWRASWFGSGLLTNLPPDKAAAALAAWSSAPPAAPVPPAAKADAKIRSWYTR